MIGFIMASIAQPVGCRSDYCYYYAMEVQNQQNNNPERMRLMLYWFTFLDFTSFFIAVAATTLAVRGITPTNPLYRGWSMTALIIRELARSSSPRSWGSSCPAAAGFRIISNAGGG